jgi:hypothetical protein
MPINNDHKPDLPYAKYLYDIDIEFGELPPFVIDKVIVRHFEKRERMRNEKYEEWWNSLKSVLDTVEPELRIPALAKGIEYGEKCLRYHKEEEACGAERGYCPADESWQRRLTIARDKLEEFKRTAADAIATSRQESPLDEAPTRNPEFTTARQVLAIHFLLEYAKTPQTDKSHVARFIEFLTGKSYKNIYDAVRNPLGTKQTGKLREADLRYILKFFDNLGLTEVVKMINNELNSSASNL